MDLLLSIALLRADMLQLLLVTLQLSSLELRLLSLQQHPLLETSARSLKVRFYHSDDEHPEFKALTYRSVSMQQRAATSTT